MDDAAESNAFDIFNEEAESVALPLLEQVNN